MNNSTEYIRKDTVFHISSLSQIFTFLLSVLTLFFNSVVVSGLQTQSGRISGVLYNQLMSLCISDLISGVVSAFHSLTLIPYVNQSPTACIGILFSYNVAQYAVLLNLSFISYRRWRVLKISSKGGFSKVWTYRRTTIGAWCVSVVCNLPSIASFSMKASMKGCPNPRLFVNGLILYTFPLYFITLLATDLFYIHMIFMMYSFHRRCQNELDKLTTNIQIKEIRREILCTLNATGVSKFLNIVSLAVEHSHVIENIKHAKRENITQEELNIEYDDKWLLAQASAEMSEELRSCVKKGLDKKENFCGTEIQGGESLISTDKTKVKNLDTYANQISAKPTKEEKTSPLLSSETDVYSNDTATLDSTVRCQLISYLSDKAYLKASSVGMEETENKMQSDVTIEMENVQVSVTTESDEEEQRSPGKSDEHIISQAKADVPTLPPPAKSDVSKSLIRESDSELCENSSLYNEISDMRGSYREDEIQSKLNILVLKGTSSAESQDISEKVTDNETRQNTLKSNEVETTRTKTDFTDIYQQEKGTTETENVPAKHRRRMKSSSQNSTVLTLLLTTLVANVVTLLHSVIFFTSKKCYEGNEFVCTYHVIALNSLLNPFLYSVAVKPIRVAVRGNFIRLVEGITRILRRA